jgi:integrase
MGSSACPMARIAPQSEHAIRSVAMNHSLHEATERVLRAHGNRPMTPEDVGTLLEQAPPRSSSDASGIARSDYRSVISDTGTPMIQTNVGHSWRGLQAQVGWAPPMRLHDLRHGAASLLIASGADLRTVMGVLGHSQIRITADTYGHLLPQVLADAAERMDVLLGS